MKKFFIKAVIMILVACVSIGCLFVNAYALLNRYTPIVDGKPYCAIENEYYSVYKEDLFAICVDVYEKYSQKNMVKQIQDYFLESVASEPSVYVTLIFTNGDISEDLLRLNTEKAEKLADKENILYVSGIDNAATVILTASQLAEAVKSDDVLFIDEAFFADRDVSYAAAIGEYTMGDVYEKAPSGLEYVFDYNIRNVTADDARFVLRFSAGLEDKRQTKRFYFAGDMDFDGRITSADARLILRVAAKTDEETAISFNYMSMWYDFEN